VPGVIDETLAEPSKDDSRLAWLWRLIEPQLRRRLESRAERRIREARLPVRKTFEAFNFGFQPKLDKDLVMELATLRFVAQGKNVLLAGMSGTGKSHIALALALLAGALFVARVEQRPDPHGGDRFERDTWFFIAAALWFGIMLLLRKLRSIRYSAAGEAAAAEAHRRHVEVAPVLLDEQVCGDLRHTEERVRALVDRHLEVDAAVPAVVFGKV